MAHTPPATPSQHRVPAASGGVPGLWLVEWTPQFVTVALLWAKLVYLSAFVRSESWSNEPSIGTWLRPTVDLVEVVVVQPMMAVGTLACLLVMLAPAVLVARGWRVVILLIANVALTVLGLADLLYVRFYGDIFSGSSFTTPRMMRDILPSILDIASATDPVYAVDLAACLLLAPLYLLGVRRVPRFGMAARWRLALATVAAGLALAVPTLGAARADDALFAPSSPRIEAAAVVGVLPYHVLEIVAPRGTDASRAGGQVERVRRYLAQERAQVGPPSSLFGVARGLNVILISAESLQSFPIGLTIHGQNVAPRLEAFARESLSFPNYHEQTYLGTTSDAQFGVLQALHPQPVGFVAMDYADRDFRALPSILVDRGYSTMAAVAAPAEFWNAEQLHPRYGFQRSYFDDAYVLNDMLGPWLSDHAFFDQTAPLLERQPEPFMAGILSSSNHHPYELPAQYRTLNLGDLQGTLLGDYLQSVHLFDAAFGAFVDRLRASGLLDRSVLVLYGDHQGFLGDPPTLGELLGRPSWNEYDRFFVRKRVPLFIRLPHGAHAGVREIVGGHLDVAPTILSLVGVEPEPVMLGRDLTRERPSLVVFRDGSLADDTHYLVQRFGSSVPAACYVIATGQPVDCAPLEPVRRAARERLEISDLIVQGNLFRALAAER